MYSGLRGPFELHISGKGYRWLSEWFVVTLGCLVTEELIPQLQGWRKGKEWVFFLWRCRTARDATYSNPGDQLESQLFCLELFL